MPSKRGLASHFSVSCTASLNSSFSCSGDGVVNGSGAGGGISDVAGFDATVASVAAFGTLKLALMEIVLRCAGIA